MKQAQSQPKLDDVRMRGFKKRSPLDAALTWLDQQFTDLPNQVVPLAQAAGRVLAVDIISQFNIPGFARSMMDGYAIIAADTQGASSYNQLPLKVIAKAMPGKDAGVRVTSGTAVRIMTGAPVPEGADAVLPAEKVEVDESMILVVDDVAEGRNIGRTGEDIVAGKTILQKGRRLRPQDIGLLASIGADAVAVATEPHIRIVATGNELLPIGATPQGHQILNANGPMLEALAVRDGGVVLSSRIVSDDSEQIRRAMLESCDILMISGGTSIGEEDLVPMLLAEMGELAIHGVTMRPSRSAGMGKVAEKMVFLIPGNPVACLCAYDFFAGRYLRKLTGRGQVWPYVSVHRKLKNKLTSMIGRTDYARVRLIGDESIQSLAVSGASILSTTTLADGFVIIPADCEGYAVGTAVEVFLYDQYRIS
jgi:molybdopterin molybdotransferase